MRMWPTLLLGSALLLLVSLYLHFFNPDLKQELKSRRKVTYKSLKTFEINEAEVRGNAQKDIETRTKKSLKTNLSFEEKITDVRQKFVKSCLEGTQFFDENPDYIDPNSKYYKNPYRARDYLNGQMSELLFSVFSIEDGSVELEQKLSQVDEGMTLEKYQNHIIEYEELIKSCGLSDTLGPVLMSFAEVVSKRKYPELNNLMIEMHVNFARSLFSLKTFTAYELGLGALRNMNSFVVLSTQESEDLINLSTRVDETYENYRREIGREAASIAEVEEAFLYYQIEREVLFQLLDEYLDNLDRSHPPDFSRIDSFLGQ